MHPQYQMQRIHEAVLGLIMGDEQAPNSDILFGHAKAPSFFRISGAPFKHTNNPIVLNPPSGAQSQIRGIFHGIESIIHGYTVLFIIGDCPPYYKKHHSSMNKIVQLYRYFLPSSPLKPLFNNQYSKLEEPFYQQLYQELNSSNAKEKHEKFILKQKLSTLAILRLLFFYHYCIRNHVSLPIEFKEACWKPVTLHCKSRQKYHALEMKTIELLRDYLKKIEGFKLSSELPLLEQIRRCNYILEILQICGKLQFNLAYRVNIPDEEVFHLIYKYLLKDTMAFLQQLCNFVDKYADLILQDHPQMLTINHIYEKTIHYHREVEKLQKFIKQHMEVPKLNFDIEKNRKIEQRILQYKTKYADTEGKKLTSTHSSFSNLPNEDSSLVNLYHA